MTREEFINMTKKEFIKFMVKKELKNYRYFLINPNWTPHEIKRTKKKLKDYYESIVKDITEAELKNCLIKYREDWRYWKYSI